MKRQRRSPTAEAVEVITNDLNNEEAFELTFISPYKGRGVFTKQQFQKGDFLLVYKGQNISSDKGEEKHSTVGESFLFFFGKSECIDASKSTGLGRMVNDCIKLRWANCFVKVIDAAGKRHLCLFAARDLLVGEELLYFYGPTDSNMYWRLGKDPAKIFFGAGQSWSSIVLLNKDGSDVRTYPMLSTVCIIGSARSCDIVVKRSGVKQQHIQLEVNSNGETFLIDLAGKTETRYLNDRDVFEIQGRVFRWEYPETVANLNFNLAAVMTDAAQPTKELEPIVIDCDIPPVARTLQTANKAGLNFKLAAVLPGAAPPAKKLKPVVIGCDIPPEARTLQTANKVDNIWQEDLVEDYDDDVKDLDYTCESSEKSNDDSGSSNTDGDIADKTSLDDECADDEMAADSENEDDSSHIYPELLSVTERKVKIQSAFRNSQGNLGNKCHSCVFCEKLFPNISRHLSLKHKNEAEVARILNLPKRSKERRKTWAILVNKGDFAHNYNVLDKGHGLIIPKYRADVEKSEVKDLLPCQYCHGMYRRTDLWKHQQFCQKPETSTTTVFGPIAAGKRLLPINCNYKLLHDNILVNMKEDEVKAAVMSDSTILEWGKGLYDEQGHVAHKHLYISQKLRDLGRLLLQLRKKNIHSIEECIQSSNWDIFIESIKEISEFNEITHQFGIPSLALRVGQHFKACAEQQQFLAMKNEDAAKIKVIDTFLVMYNIGWKKAVSSKAMSTQLQRKYNKTKLLPLVEDVVLLNKFLKDKAIDLHLSDNIAEVYPEFTQVCLAQVILFNRKRSGEAERMTTSGYQDAKKGGIIDPVISNILNEFKQKLAETHLRMEIIGKKGRKVPVLLTDHMQENIETLLEMRKNADVSE